MRFSRFLKFLSLFLALGLVPAWAEADNPSTANSRSARPGTVNYVEGQVSLGRSNPGREIRWVDRGRRWPIVDHWKTAKRRSCLLQACFSGSAAQVPCA